VIGHTDSVGTLEANDALSLRRAATVRALLVTQGVAESSIEVAGRGEREPLVPVGDEVAEPKNRRVEINLR
jgi:outer membrane protein OmpA-like peptidoglycan-associated protein